MRFSISATIPECFVTLYINAQEKSIDRKNVALAIAFFKDLNGIIKYYIVSVILEDDLIDNLFFCVRLED